MIHRVVPLWAAALLLGCPQVLDDRFDVGGRKPSDGSDASFGDAGAGSVLDTAIDAGVLDQLGKPRPPAPDPGAEPAGAAAITIVSSVPAEGALGVLPGSELSSSK